MGALQSVLKNTRSNSLENSNFSEDQNKVAEVNIFL